ncbi:MAG: recombinase family protein [Chloroflexi bacterium]|nr:recombinase family protein [Chloroflexota bacterium]
MSRSKLKAAGYIRVSDESQVEGLSLDAQRREIIRNCERQGYELSRIYADEGVSAYTDRVEARPQFTQLLEDAERGIYDVVIVHTIDRWARPDFCAVADARASWKSQRGFFSITENIDYTTPFGKLVLTYIGALVSSSAPSWGCM